MAGINRGGQVICTYEQTMAVRFEAIERARSVAACWGGRVVKLAPAPQGGATETKR